MRSRLLSSLACLLVVLSAGTSPGASEQRFAPPVPGPILRHFEPPPTEFSAGHRGIDLGAAVGTVVRASEAGTVTFAGQVGGRLYLTISHGELSSTYSFLSSLMVGRNDVVARDQAVATTGDGHAGADRPHLHFGIKRGEEYLDPEPFLLATLRKEPWRVVRLVPS